MRKTNAEIQARHRELNERVLQFYEALTKLNRDDVRTFIKISDKTDKIYEEILKNEKK